VQKDHGKIKYTLFMKKKQPDCCCDVLDEGLDGGLEIGILMN